MREDPGWGTLCDFPVCARGSHLTSFLGVMFFSYVNPISLFHLPLPHRRFGSVAPDGQYHSPIKDKSARFNAMLAVLTPSRLAVTFQATGSVKVTDSDVNFPRYLFSACSRGG